MISDFTLNDEDDDDQWWWRDTDLSTVVMVVAIADRRSTGRDDDSCCCGCCIGGFCDDRGRCVVIARPRLRAVGLDGGCSYSGHVPWCIRTLDDQLLLRYARVFRFVATRRIVVARCTRTRPTAPVRVFLFDIFQKIFFFRKSFTAAAATTTIGVFTTRV